ncbi:MAG: hypothetical protein IJV67_05450, partial [Clostridia bacterium]|nr:hypothetical protein [Clostridia bacterium]
GVINDGTELFGAKTGDGFGELSQYDSDGNGWSDEGDAVFSQLSGWVKAGNEEARLLSLKEADVGAIFLGSQNTQFAVENPSGETGAMLRKTGLYLKEKQLPLKCVLPAYEITNLFIDSKENIWISTYKDGLFVWNKEGKVSHFSQQTGELTSNQVRNVVFPFEHLEKQRRSTRLYYCSGSGKQNEFYSLNYCFFIHNFLLFENRIFEHFIVELSADIDTLRKKREGDEEFIGRDPSYFT